jgi:superfamily II DNA or RNA helicase
VPLARPPAAGDLVWIRRRRWRIDRLRVDGDVQVLDVKGPDLRRTFLAPFDRLGAEHGIERLRHISWPHLRARILAWAAHTYSVRTTLAALDANVEILPFQLEAALAFLNGARRVLVADAVGLGKTIQAGLVVAETMRRAVNGYVLILVPASLRDQWIGELTRRFRIRPTTADADNLRHLAGEVARGESPWRPGVWIATPDFVKQPHVFDALPAVRWDLVVIDEAHDVAGRSDRHLVCDALARQSRRVMLLTATPHNGDASAFARLRDLGDLGDLGPADSGLVVLRRTASSLGWPENRRVRWHHVTPTPAEERALSTLIAFEQAVIRAAGIAHRSAALLLLSVLRKRGLSTMAALAVSLRRRAAWLDAARPGELLDWRQKRLSFGGEPDDAFRDDEDAALTFDVGLGHALEQAWLRRLLTLVDQAAADDSKVRRVTGLVARRHEPVVVFTEFRHSLEAVCRKVGTIAVVTALHGGLTPHERQTSLERFLGGEASVLVATDVAGQGLNLQMRSRWVVNLELPWNPARLAQRAGRVDRIGQTRPVHVTLLVSRHQTESELLTRIAQRAVRSENAMGVSLVGAEWPTESDLGAELIANSSRPRLAGEGRPEVSIDHTWRRHARWLARLMRRRRLWAAQWQGADPSVTRTLVARRRAAPGALGPSGGWLFLFSVPIVDATGEVLETRLAAIRGPGEAAMELDWSLVERARAIAAGRVRRRCDRVRQLVADRARATAAIDRAIARHVRARRAAELAQPGLFDRPTAAAPSPRERVVAEIGPPPAVAVGRVALVAAIALQK